VIFSIDAGNEDVKFNPYHDEKNVIIAGELIQNNTTANITQNEVFKFFLEKLGVR
jgi:hypothetical protein